MNARYESKGSRAQVLVTGFKNRDQLSQTDDFVQIYLIYS